jgi:multisubunit Na+/H+ antiporter MnhG subunit
MPDRTGGYPSDMARYRPSARATYFWLMGTCVALIVLAWNVVRFWSVPAAVGMSVVAAVIPPVAAMLAGRGRGGG